MPVKGTDGEGNINADFDHENDRVTLTLDENRGSDAIITTFGHTVAGTTISPGVSGADGDLFTVNQRLQLVYHGEAKNFEGEWSSFNLSIEFYVTDAAGVTTRENYQTTVQIGDVDEKPTEIVVDAVRTRLSDGVYTDGKKLADISFVDDALGTNTPVLTGASAQKFEIRGNADAGWELWLRAGMTLNQATDGTSVDVTVTVDDQTTGEGDSPNSVDFTLTLTGVNTLPRIFGADNNPAASYSFEVDEDIKDTDVIGEILAFDKDGDDIGYRLATENLDLFELQTVATENNGEKGHLSLRPGRSLDYETLGGRHELTAWVFGTGANGIERITRQVTITVNNVIEANNIEIIQLADAVAGAKIGKVKFGNGGIVTVSEGGAQSTNFKVEKGFLVVEDGVTLTANTHSLVLTTGTGSNASSHNFKIKVNAIVPEIDETLLDSIHEGGTLALSNTKLGKDGQLETLYFVEKSGTTTTPSGSYTVSENGEQLVYTPNPDFTGKDTFSVAIRDDSGGTTTQEVVITVQPPLDITGRFTAWEDEPTADPSGTLGIPGTIPSSAYALSISDTDIPAGGSQTVPLQYGTLTVEQDRSWSYALDNTNATVEALDGDDDDTDGGVGSLTETVTVEMAYGGETLTETFDIIINGRTDFYISEGEMRSDHRNLEEDLSLHSGSESDGFYYVHIHGGSGNDVLNGGVGNNGFIGGPGNDVMNGGGGKDGFDGGSGDDVMNGGDGNDGFIGGRGNDVMNAGDGNDTAVFWYLSITSDIKLDVSGGSTRWKQNDDGTWDSGTGDGFIYQRIWIDLDGSGDETSGDEFDYFTGIENFRFFAGSGNSEWTTGNGDDWLLSDTGDDVLNGGDGDDWLDGASGDDVLNAGGGDDQINGGPGDDVLNGGDGDDWLFADSGDDIFVLNLKSGLTNSDRDIVTDFSSGTVSGYRLYDGSTDGGNDKIRVAISTSGGNTLNLDADQLKDAANIRWTNDTNYSYDSGQNDASINDTIIYAKLDTPNDISDDVVLMVLEDFTTRLAISHFDVVEIV